ncbi:MAG TPA: YeeE/YedE thiosulfate transporter family protein [Kofleriaceae bacterium]|nr:YeeE/YedE thiosulfate transporter family protein [Kofleriaceae bacterium]
MHDFTPGHAIVGGLLIGLGLAIILIGSGRIAGLSGIAAGLINPFSGGDRAWRASFLAGALAVGAIFELVAPRTYDAAAPHRMWVVAVSGVLVGIGTRLAHGCTSGHGLCGLARLSKRSLIATLTFFAIGVATATLVGRLA